MIWKQTTFKVFLWCLCLLSVTNQLTAQNLVNNPSFEQQLSCPTNLDNIGNVAGTGDAGFWFSPTDGSPDYFNACVDNNTTAGVPSNFYGSQAAFNGGESAYAGFLAYDNDNNSRDYLSVQLSQPLNVGTAYCVEFQVSLAEFTYFATENIGLHFSETALDVTNGGIHLGITPQVTNDNGVIFDKIGWTTISATFVADVAHQYLTIGNFNSNANTNTADLTVAGIEGPLVSQSYYYVDAVSVQAMPEIVIAATPNQLSCEGGTTTLVATGGDSFTWAAINDPFTILSSDASFSPTISATQTFIVTATNGSCSLQETITIPVQALPTVDFTYSAACTNFSTVFTDNSLNAFDNPTYAWDFDGDGINDITGQDESVEFEFPTAGVYEVTLTVLNQAGTCEAATLIEVTVFDDCDPCSEAVISNNIVPNPNLENFAVCPDTLTQIEAADFWYSPTLGNADYFNACATNDTVAVPNNLFGSQTPLSGDGYFGMFTFGNNYREYVSTQLETALVAGDNYCVSFNVSLADSVGRAADHIGVYFSNDSINVGTQFPLNFTPQVENVMGNIITNTTEWTNVSDVFVANDSNDWITIGNFYDDFNTMSMAVPNDGPLNTQGFAYYYIDDITVSAIPQLNINETQIVACVGDDITLNVTDDAFCAYAWVNADSPTDTLSTTTSFNFNIADATTTQFIVYADFGQCSVSQTIDVTINEFPDVQFEALENCAGAATAFINNSTNVLSDATYAWDFENDGVVNSTSAEFAAYIYPTAGTYTAKLVITNAGGCQDSLLLEVNVAQDCVEDCTSEDNLVANAGFEQGICPNELGQIDSTQTWTSLSGSEAVVCSEFNNNCIDVVLLPIITNDDGSNTYQYELTNNCTQSFFYASFEIAGGVFATDLSPSSIYNGDPNLGYTYSINYPFANADIPFFGIQFEKNTADGPKNGDTETFAYTLPASEPVPTDVQIVVQLSNSPVHHYVFSLATNSVNCNGQGESTDNFFTNGFPADWFSNCGGSQDETDVAIPINAYGSQLPHGGDSYAGLIAYSTAGIGQHQYLTSELAQPLVEGQMYCAKMFVSLAESSDFAIDQLGIYFSETMPNTSSPLYQTPQINNTAENYLFDQNAWLEVGTTFVADSAYQYITIGNFEAYPTNSLLVGTNTEGIAYYYIDDVSIVPVELTISEDETICQGENIDLEATTNLCDVYWINSDNPTEILGTTNNLNISPDTTSTYIFVANNGNCELTDSVSIIVNALPNAEAGLDTFICVGSSLQLQATGGNTYEWSPTNFMTNENTATPTLTITDIGLFTYFVTVTDDATGCQNVDSIDVKTVALPMADAGNDTIHICQDAFINLGASGGVSYAWSPAEQLSDATIADPLATTDDLTTFYVTVTNALGCEAVDSVVLIAQEAYDFMQIDTTICAGDSAILDVPVPPSAVGFIWTPNNNLSANNIANPTTYATSNTLYTLTYEDDLGCIGQIAVSLNINPIPNAGSDIQICANGSAQLNASAGGETYMWSPAASLNQADVRNPIAMPTETTTYIVTVTYADGLESCSQTDSVTVFVVPAGTADAGQDITICSGESVELNAIGGDTYLWNADASLSQTDIPNPTATPTETTTYTVTTTNQNTGCTATDEVTVIVNPADTPSVTTQDNQTIYCAVPFEPITICFNTDYAGCEDLINSVDNQLGSDITLSANCLTYEGAFVAAQSDTISFNACTVDSDLCESLEIVIVACDQAPVWLDDVVEATACVSTAVSIPLPGAIDVDEGDVLTFEVAQTNNGTANLAADQLIYTPDTDFIGLDTVLLTVCDSFYPTNDCDTLIVSINAGFNSAPVANLTTATTNYETASVICIVANDPEGHAVSFGNFGTINDGTAEITNDNCITFTPNNGFSGLTNFTIEVCDECGECYDAPVEVTVLPEPNTPPQAEDIVVTTDFNTTTTACFIIIDADTDDTHTLTYEGGAANGIVTNLAVPCFDYTPLNDFVGTETLTFEICDAEDCITVTATITVLPPPNEAPIVVSDTTTTLYEVPILICPEITDPEGQSVMITNVGTPANGTVLLSSDTCFIYTPNDGFSGIDSFEITVCDNLNACTTITQYVEVLPKPNAAPESGDITIILPNGVTTVDFCLNIVEPDGDPYTVVELTPAQNGTFTFTNDTCINYMTGPTFEGNDEFEVIICDDLGACEEVTIYVVENFPPQVSDVYDTTAYATPITFCPEIVEPEGQDVTITVIELINGFTIVLSDSCVEYTPSTFIGTQEIVFTVCDAAQACDTASAFITVLPPNETPIADDVSITTTQNTPIDWCIPVTDANDDDLSINIILLPQNGNVAPQADTTCLSYTPTNGFLGQDSVQIAICDPALACDTVWTFINVIEPCQNDTVYACTAVNSIVDICVSYCLLSENAQTDIANATAMFGSMNLLSDTCIQYTPQVGFEGTDTLVLPAFDNISGGADTVVAVINVGCVAPIAYNDITTVPSGTQVTIEVLDNDFSPCNDDVAVSILTPPFEGTATTNNDNTAIIYSSPALFEGSDSLVYQACINCNGDVLCSTATVYISNLLNLPPQVSDTIVTTAFETPIEICLDVTDPEGQIYGSQVVVAATDGTVLPNANNDDCFTYTPNGGFNGTDTFDVQFCDGNNGCTTITVTVNVEAEPNEIPQINDETITTPFETDEIICLTISDADHDISELSVSILNNPLNGTITIDANNCVTYSPGAGFSGNDQFVVQVCDPLGACDQATISVTVLENNTPPIVEPVSDIIMGPSDEETVCLDISDLEGDLTNVTIAGISPNEGTATLNGNCLTYASSSTQSGTYTITLEICDDSDIIIACTTIDINFIVNSPPLVFNQTYTIDQNTTLDDCLTISEPNENDYFINIGNAPNDGTIDFIGDCFTYIPDPSFVGTDEVTIQVCDEYNDCTLAVITIIVEDIFAAANDTISVGNGGSTTFDVIGNDTFPANADITVDIVTQPSSGTLIDNGDGTFTYIADANFDGEVTFTYQICDTDLGCETATVIINVVNGLQATDDIDITTFTDTPIDIPILDNDIYPDTGVDIVIINSGEVNGVVSEVGNTGVYTFLPDPSFVGVDTFMYVISAAGFGSDTAIVVVTVLELPELPIAVNDTASGIAGTSIHIDVLANDTDSNTGNLTVVDIVEAASNGLATIEADGTVTYSPNTSFVGIDSFTYAVCNPDLGNGEAICDTATVYITITSDAGCEVSVYSALSPNGDGLNDFLEATGLGCAENQQNEFMIFNRWGNLVFETENYGSSNWWDGTFKDSGNIVPDGTYFYVLTIESQNIKLQGFIEVNK